MCPSRRQPHRSVKDSGAPEASSTGQTFEDIVLLRMRPPNALAALLTLSLTLSATSSIAGEIAKSEAPKSRPRRGLLIGGAVTFAVGYLPALLIAEESLRFGYPAGALMLIPVAGPFVTAGIEKAKKSHSLLFATMLVDGALQTAGAVLLFLAFRGSPADESAATSRLLIGPGPNGAPLGMTLTFLSR